jgi:hypothetical protein
MNHFLEFLTPQQAEAMTNLKPGAHVACGDRIEVVTKIEVPAMWTKAADGEESHYLCMIGVPKAV